MDGIEITGPVGSVACPEILNPLWTLFERFHGFLLSEWLSGRKQIWNLFVSIWAQILDLTPKYLRQTAWRDEKTVYLVQGFPTNPREI